LDKEKIDLGGLFFLFRLNFRFKQTEYIFGGFLGDIEYIYDIENSESVEYEKDEEPTLISSSGCCPKSITFPRQDPEHA
jgi:hypothetical protein